MRQLIAGCPAPQTDLSTTQMYRRLKEHQRRVGGMILRARGNGRHHAIKAFKSQSWNTYEPPEAEVGA